jgi:hypothetical protein
MKNTAILMILTLVFTSSAVFARTSSFSTETTLHSAISGSFKILNDTGAEVQIHTGSGFVELNKGSSTSITCEAGREIRKANKGKKGDVIFTVDDSMCGKTVKLSQYL